MKQTGGGSILQPMGGYLGGPAPVPADAGGNLLPTGSSLWARPPIPTLKGGFIPSVMGGVVDAGSVTLPAAFLAGRRMFTAKRKGGARKGNVWAEQRQRAKQILERYGVPNGTNISAFASRYFEGRKKYNPTEADRFVREFQGKVARGERKRMRSAAPARSRRPQPLTPPSPPRRTGRTRRAPNRLTYTRPETPRSRTRRAAPAAAAAARPTRSWQNEIRNAYKTIRARQMPANAILATRLAKARRNKKPNEEFFRGMPAASAAAAAVPRPLAAAAAPARQAPSVITRTGRLRRNNAEERRQAAKVALQRLGIKPSGANIQRYVAAMKRNASRDNLEALERNIRTRKALTRRPAAAAPMMAQRPPVRFAAPITPNSPGRAAPYELYDPEND